MRHYPFSQDVEGAAALQKAYQQLRSEIGKVIIGQEEVVKLVLAGIFCNGHSLLIGVPGLAKTLLVQTISKALDLKFNRIQFTPDLMPSDITGSEILDEHKNFRFIHGPLFANIILADEINRTPPKTQAALLEAMQERTVTVGGKLYPLPEPFFVLATQNPIEQEGTYPLPEAQLDRFMFNIFLDYPSLQEEIMVVKQTTGIIQQEPQVVLSGEDIIAFRQLVRKAPVADNVVEFAVKLVNKTRSSSPLANDTTRNYLAYGAGPRASQFLVLAAKCNALLNGKYSPDIEDIEAVAVPVLRHRLVKNYRAEAEGVQIEEIIKKLIA